MCVAVHVQGSQGALFLMAVVLRPTAVGNASQHKFLIHILRKTLNTDVDETKREISWVHTVCNEE